MIKAPLKPNRAVGRANLSVLLQKLSLPALGEFVSLPEPSRLIEVHGGAEYNVDRYSVSSC